MLLLMLLPTSFQKKLEAKERYEHMSCDSADTVEQEISNKLRILNLSFKRAANIIFKRSLKQKISNGAYKKSA